MSRGSRGSKSSVVRQSQFASPHRSSSGLFRCDQADVQTSLPAGVCVYNMLAACVAYVYCMYCVYHRILRNEGQTSPLLHLSLRSLWWWHTNWCQSLLGLEVVVRWVSLPLVCRSSSSWFFFFFLFLLVFSVRWSQLNLLFVCCAVRSCASTVSAADPWWERWENTSSTTTNTSARHHSLQPTAKLFLVLAIGDTWLLLLLVNIFDSTWSLCFSSIHHRCVKCFRVNVRATLVIVVEDRDSSCWPICRWSSPSTLQGLSLQDSEDSATAPLWSSVSSLSPPKPLIFLCTPYLWLSHFRCCFFDCPYVDRYGEPNIRRGKTLQLDDRRLNELRQMLFFAETGRWAIAEIVAQGWTAEWGTPCSSH